MTYINSSFFALILIPVSLRSLFHTYYSLDDCPSRKYGNTKYDPLIESGHSSSSKPDTQDVAVINDDYTRDEDDPAAISDQRRLSSDEEVICSGNKLTLRETTRLSLDFSVLWVCNFPTLCKAPIDRDSSLLYVIPTSSHHETY